ncbi:hypothetical protein [Sinorhizobium meliloti]|jgi:hypothetical protein|uniref:hypothetical protein n=1 Tax=Rhizobium meliloti TaxID=382 RepID=UPI00035EC2C7|nr:hypothetical protein [Sinorhizobium meliloti]MDE4595937.1 hypothetical protein [Sinorhizobium meliloti]MQU93822.1 hypothetical protein [Sinorhizobium meliloti]
MTLREQLILVSDEFGRARGIGRQRVSTIVLNRGSTLDLLAQSRSDLNTGTFERAMLWFSENWPEGAEWPDCVSRPLVSEAAE